MFGSLTERHRGNIDLFRTAEQLQKFHLWSMGNLGNLRGQPFPYFVYLRYFGLLLFPKYKVVKCFIIKTMLSLGMNYKKSKINSSFCYQHFMEALLLQVHQFLYRLLCLI
jgi:hypothetical protein